VIPFFDYPWALIAAPLLGLGVAALLIFAVHQRTRRLHRLGADSLVARLLPAAMSRRQWWRAILLGTAAMLGGVAFAGPKWGTEELVERGTGVDVVLALDASLSMLATDERPNRLQRMKDEARRLLALSGGDRFGLLAFAGHSYILTPLTVDHGALELFLDNLDPTVVGQAGTSVARAIRQGTDLLGGTPTGSDRALVIMSDGEAFESDDDIVAEAKRAAEAGITLITVGFGTVQGSTIPIRTPEGVTVKRDQDGQVVVTQYTPKTLSEAASAGNGTFIDAGSTDKAARIRHALSALRAQGRTASSGSERKPRFQLFLIPALLLVLAETVLVERRGRMRPMPAASRSALAAALLLLLAVPRAARADQGEEGDRLFKDKKYKEAAAAYERAIRSGSDTPRLEYNLGTALLAAGRLDDAITALERAATQSRDLDIRFRALFNLGLVNLTQARAAKGPDAAPLFGAAEDAYKRALRVRPTDPDAKWNYELALISKRKASGGGGGGGGTGGSQDANRTPRPPGDQAQQPAGGLDPRQAEQLLSSAEREEREVQAKKQLQNQPEHPPGGKDW